MLQFTLQHLHRHCSTTASLITAIRTQEEPLGGWMHNFFNTTYLALVNNNGLYNTDITVHMFLDNNTKLMYIYMLLGVCL